MPPISIQAGHEVIEILSDSEEEGLIGDQPEFFDARSAQHNLADWPDFDEAFNNAEVHFSPNDGEPIDLTAIPDIDIPPSDAIVLEDEDPRPVTTSHGWTSKGDLVTENDCVQRILDVLPDISVDHVLKMIKEKTTDVSRTTAQCELLLTQILDGETYPKEADDMKNKKRKRGHEDDFSDYEKGERDPEVSSYERDA